VWPPLLTTSGHPPASPGTEGTVGMTKRPDGGAQANGQGISGTWFAVTS
jgi:hypothetical protein